MDRTYSLPQGWSQAGAEEKDSDDEAAQDDVVPLAIRGEELVRFKYDHRELHKAFHQARDTSFQNPYGNKNFVRYFYLHSMKC